MATLLPGLVESDCSGNPCIPLARMGIQREPLSRLRKENALTTLWGVPIQTSFEPRLCPTDPPNPRSQTCLSFLSLGLTVAPAPPSAFTWSSSIQTHLTLGQQHCCPPHHPMCDRHCAQPGSCTAAQAAL